MIALGILAFLGLAVGWLLLVPVVMRIDTGRNIFQVTQAGIFKFWLNPNLQPNVKIAGIRLRLSSDQSKPKEHPVVHKNRKPVSMQRITDLVPRILRSMDVDRFHVDVDLDDVVVNAQLVPVFHFMSRGPFLLTTNFEGRVYANIRIRIWVFRIVWAFLLFFTKK